LTDRNSDIEKHSRVADDDNPYILIGLISQFVGDGALRHELEMTGGF
jgi:hypothetical protein